MKCFNKKKKTFILIYLVAFLFLSFFQINVSASGVTDINDINDGFYFNDSNASFGKDMSFHGANDTTDDTAFWKEIFSKYRTMIMATSGAISLLLVALFIINIMKYSASSGNPQARKNCLITILWTGVGTALFGGTTILVGITSNLIK